MADKRISQLVERVDIANNDVVPIVASGATTTNKATISSIQTFMQENLDVGVTSVGITIGTSGTDVSVTGSPVTTSGNITINIPDASASARGVVTSESQTFGGVKTFADGLSLPSLGGGNQITKIVNIGTLHQGSGSLNQIGFNSGNNIYFGKGLSNGGVISWNNSAARFYTLQDADGTLAFTSDIPSLAGYVTLNTAQTITAQKTFTTSGSSDTMIISHGSGSGFALDVIKAGNNEAIRVRKTSGSGNAMSITGGNFSAEAATFSGVVTTTPDAIINGVNVGRGGGVITSNTILGQNSLNANTTGNSNTAIGQASLPLNTTGSSNTAVGRGSLEKNTIAIWNCGVGTFSLFANTTGSSNIAFGNGAGAYIADGTTENSITNNSVFLGGNTKALANDQTNQIVIGHNAIGNGSNTVTLGNDSITNTYLKGAVTLTGALNGTSASFSTEVTSSGGQGRFGGWATGAGYQGNALEVGVSGGNAFMIGYNRTSGSYIPLSIGGTTNQTTTIGGSSIVFQNNGVTALTLASTGAATFSSSVGINGATTNFPLTVKVATNQNLRISTETHTAVQAVNDAVNAFVPLKLDGSSLLLNTQSGGNVGIGTDSPANPLHVETSGSDGGIQIYRNVNNDDGSAALFISHKSTAGVIKTVNIEALGTGDMLFRTGATGLATFGTTRMRLTSGGNVGIGTDSPQTKLQINQGTDLNVGFNTTSVDSVTTSRITSYNDAFNLSLGLAINGSPLVLQTGGDERMRLTSGGYLKVSNTGSYDNTSSSSFEFINNTAGGNSLLVRNINTSYTAALLRLTCDRISTNAAYYLIIATNGNSSGEFRVADSGNVTNTNNSYGAISDIKLKENIEDATQKLDDLMKVKVRNYNLIGDDKKQIGVIAQELEEVFPAMIDESEDFEEVEVPQLDEEGNEVLNEEGEVVTEKQRVSKGTSTKSVKYSVFVPMLIKAMQEQQEQIKVLTEQIDSLKNQMQ